MQPELAVDVLILGAGPAGTATALSLLAAGVGRVLLVEKPSTRPFAIGESAAPTVAKLLEALGLTDDLSQLGHRPYQGNLSLWGDGPPVVDHFLFRGQGHGWQLDRAAFNAWLQQAAVARGAQFACPATLTAIAPAPAFAGWQVTVSSLGQVFARVVVDATGRGARLATQLGARWQKLDALVALATWAPPAPGLAGLALVEPFADGWWYAACLPNGQAVVTLMTDQDVAKARGWHTPAAYLQAWRATEQLAARVPPPPELTAITVFAAHSGFLNRAAGRGWLAVGDALLAFDPLTAAGIAGALADALAAGPAIQAQLHGDLASSRAYAQRANATLKRYLTERQQHYRAERRWATQAFWARRAGV